MLVITRKAGDRVRIGDDITVTVLEVTGSSVRIGIDAPVEIPVYRHEIIEATEAENRAAAAATIAELPTLPMPGADGEPESPPDAA